MMRIATYNIEWMAHLFDEDNQLLRDDTYLTKRRQTRKDQADAIAHIFHHIDADIWLIVEAPNHGRSQSTIKALENFARHYQLRASKAIIGHGNNTQQELAFLYDPARLTLTHSPRESHHAPAFDGKFEIDLDIDNRTDLVEWSKPPIEVSATLKDHPTKLRLIGVHAKSKAPHGAHSPREAAEISLRNRRKQLAQCIWLRRRVDDHLNIDETLMVLGDFNDGPGLDQYETLFGRSGVEIVLGAEKDTKMQLFDPHAQNRGRNLSALPATARFFDNKSKRYVNSLLDFIMLSPDIARFGNWRIWHPFDDPDCFENTELRQALLVASDHFPVTVDLNLPSP